jgi:hypothetical protein
MTDDLYRMALATLQRHLEAAGVQYSLEDGDFTFGGHRLGLSITFDGFVEQDKRVIAPVDVQLHVDDDDGSRFRVGTLGVGDNQSQAMKSAIEEWHLLAATPVLAALRAPAGDRRRELAPQSIAGWTFFPGRVGIRGTLPSGLETGGDFYRRLLAEFQKFVSKWPAADEFTLRSIFVMYSSADHEAEVQAAVDGFMSEPLSTQLKTLPWPHSPGAYLYKQLFVFRGGAS